MTFTEFKDDDFQVVYLKPELNIDNERFETIYIEYPLEMSTGKYAFPNPDLLLSYVTYEGEINQFAQDSVKVGLWRRSSETYDYLIYYGENEGNSGSEWRASFDKNGILQEICGRDGLGESSCADRRNYFRLFLIADGFEEF